MGLFSRKKKGAGAPAGSRREQKAARAATVAHLSEFATTRVGVEAYYEEPTPRAEAAILLVAIDGEWTRRRVPDRSSAADVANALGIPFYEVIKTGYPDSMRKFNERKRQG